LHGWQPTLGERTVECTGRNKTLGSLLDLGLMSGCESYDFAEELLVDLAENVRYRLTASG
jgi:hypothetical protein